MVLSRLLQSKAVLMHIGSQIINQFHGWIEKNKCSNVIRQRHAAVLSVFTSAYHPPLSLSPYLPGLINLSAGHWKLCRLTSSLLSSQLCLPTGRWGHVCVRERFIRGVMLRRNIFTLLVVMKGKAGNQENNYRSWMRTFPPETGYLLGYCTRLLL